MTAAAPRAHARGRAGARLAGLAGLAFGLGRGLALVLSLVALQPAPAWAQATPGAAATLTVGAGDTATALAQKLRPEAATLEQTLVAIWRANPRAFANGNLNLLLQGASLQVPSEADVLRTPAPQARALVLEQVDNFQAFARQQGASASTAATSPAGTKPTTPDAAAWARALAEAQALKDALERQSRDTQARLAQLEKNIQALQALKAPAPSALAAPATPAATPAATIPATTPAGTPGSAPQPAASETAATPHPPAASEPEAASAVSATADASATDASAAAQTSPASTASTDLQALTGLDRPTLLWSAAGTVLALMLLWTLLHQRRQARAQTEAAAAARIEIPPQMASIDLNLGGPLSPQREDPRP